MSTLLFCVSMGRRRWNELVDNGTCIGIYPQHGGEYVASLLHCHHGKPRQSGHVCGYQFPGFGDQGAEGGGYECCAVFAEVSFVGGGGGGGAHKNKTKKTKNNHWAKA